ncbi:MAG: protein kinase [Bacteroidales bacterium]|nr:protein kinase [Bacteroidales bacterium]
MAEQLTGTKGIYILTGRQGGKGKFGGIWTGTTADGQKSVSVKCVEKYGQALPAIMGRLMTVDHPNVAHTLDSWVCEDGCLYIVREYVKGTDLKTIFTTKELYRKVDEMKYVHAGLSVLKALQQVHGAGVIHRDVKPSNIVIPHGDGESPIDQDFSKAVLIDFEQCSTYPDTSDVRSSFALVFSPPEMLLKRNKLVCPASDLFALSISLFQLIMGKAPYSDCNPEILVNLQLTYPMKQPARMDDQLFAVLSKAAYKASFPRPPRQLQPTEVENILRQGIDGRYQSAEEMYDELIKVEKTFKPVSWLNKMFG